MSVPYSQVVKTKRESMGLTQVQFGEMIGVSGSTIASFESGKNVSESIVKLIRYELRNLEDSMSDKERFIYSIVKEAKLIQFENNEDLLLEKTDNIEFACLRLRKYLRNKNR